MEQFVINALLPRLVIGLKEDVKVEDLEDKEINEEAKLTAIESA